MSFVTRSARLAVGFLLVAAPPARAASPVTQTFLANVMPNVDFLDRSSRFALDNSKDKRIRAFALSEAREQTLAINALYDWTQADANPMIASTTATKLDQTPTGSTKPSDPPPQPAADTRLPVGQEDLDSLEGLEGQEFDTQYKDKQRDALRQVATDYEDYIANGDDPALAAIAARDLPKVKKRLALLGTM